MLIECKDLVKKYRLEDRELQAVDHVSFSVAEGDFVAILGHSGSGKTTLLSMIGGLARPDQGNVYINGVDCWRQSELKLAGMRNQLIGFIFQFGSLIPTMTAIENVLLPLSFADPGSDPSAKIPLARELLDQVGLADKENSFPAQLSGGQQRRVAIARAFINRPGIILADEPTGDLDEDTEGEILEIFRQYNTEKKTTFLVVTHNSKLVLTQNNPRTFLMKDGQFSEARISGST
ncbi:MAG: ABC transporter ATP-binding protein [Desulfurivibrionaceae bacterium]|nr:ABC transporter ATP-binding protein [Desulfobulbales bacterium]MDT8334234.1 ABC transporter ATP-binding protein [Desulfurivibrionaceae bacterium]